MTTRPFRNNNASQIVFDIHGGDNQFTTMNLQTIPNRPKIVRRENENFNMRTDDIDGAQYRPPKIYNHNFNLDVSDIEGTKTTPMVDEKKKPNNIMNIDDIEGARPRIQRQLPHSARNTNPLNPEYKLPTKEEEPIPPPKFIRDNINVDDIDGTHSRSYKTNKPPKDIMKVDDIQGTRPRRRILCLDPDGTCNGIRFESTCNRSLNVKDINNEGVFKTTRTTDPLNPVYRYDGQQIEATDYGRAFPRKYPKNVIDYQHTTNDIEGAQADSSTTFIRNFKRPTQDQLEMNSSDVLMLPSMKKQTQQLEAQEKLRKMRQEKVSMYENRNMFASHGTGDPIQEILRQQRENRAGRKPTQTINTF